MSGEPGIGKTRLVSEFAADIGERGATVLYGRAEQEALVPYQPLVEALRAPPRHGFELPSTTSALRLFDAVGDMLDAVAASRPLLLVLDDLHWAEPPTIRLLRHLAARSGDAPRMIVATYRDTEDSPFSASVASLYRELEVDRITLDGLGHDAVAALLGGQRSNEDVRALREQTGGNPFFIEQLLPGDPMGVTETVERRIAVLGPEAHAVLDAAAVSGAEFELEVARRGRRPSDRRRAGRTRCCGESAADQRDPRRSGSLRVRARDRSRHTGGFTDSGAAQTPSRTVRRGARATCGARS